MVKTLQKHGNSVALLFDKTMLETMNMTPDTPVQVTITSGSMTISPINIGVDEDELMAHMERLLPKYKRMMENLAK